MCVGAGTHAAASKSGWKNRHEHAYTPTRKRTRAPEKEDAVRRRRTQSMQQYDQFDAEATA
jgi:hypothetical protein